MYFFSFFSNSQHYFQFTLKMVKGSVCRNMFVTLTRVVVFFKSTNTLLWISEQVTLVSVKYCRYFLFYFNLNLFSSFSLRFTSWQHQVLLQEFQPSPHVTFCISWLDVTRLKWINFTFFWRGNIDKIHYLLQCLFVIQFVSFILFI